MTGSQLSTGMYNVGTMLAERVSAARRRAGLTQKALADVLKRDRSLMSHVEAGRRGLAYDALPVLAKVLNTSVDYLVGLTDDPSPVRQPGGPSDAGTEVVPINSEEAMGGFPGAAVTTLEGTGMPFRRFRLEQEGIDPENASVFRVQGDSMHPTLPDRSVILVDYLRTELRDNCLYVIRSGDYLVAKRVHRREDGWWLHCDNPDWSPVPWEEQMRVRGQIRWVGHGFPEQRA